MLRKPQCDFGWDWNIALAPLGLHGRIALIGPEGEIADAQHPQHHRDGRVTLDLTVGSAASAADTAPGGSPSAAPPHPADRRRRRRLSRPR